MRSSQMFLFKNIPEIFFNAIQSSPSVSSAFFKNKMDNKGRLVKNLPDAVVEEKPSKL